MATPSRSRYAWRLVHAPEWAAIQEHGFFEGSAIDHRDGYLHMSPASEVKRSAIIYFAGVTDLWLLKIDLENTAIASHIRHDHVASRNADFPHLYDVKLPRDAVVAAWALPLDAATGAFTFPPRELD